MKAGEFMKAIEIEGLFDRFHYKIDFRENEIIIITGPNGFGKSTILRILKAVRDSDLAFFRSLNFKRITLTRRSDQKELTIANDSAQKQLMINSAVLTWQEVQFCMSVAQRRRMLDMLQSGTDTETDKRRIALKKYQAAMNELAEFLGRVEFIEEQRLLTGNDSDRTFDRMREIRSVGEEVRRRETSRQNVIKVIETIPDKLKRRIAHVASRYAEIASTLDSTYPKRLFEEGQKISEAEFQERMRKITPKFERLDKFQISEIDVHSIRDIKYSDQDAKALKVYLDDLEKKYEVYDELLEKLDMYTRLVNEKLYFSRVQISKMKGCIVEDKETGRNLELSKLSSGEQELVVLFYRLIFEIGDETLLLLDEPEISLHVAWQYSLISDLREIMQKKNMQFIIATHSPMLINGNSDIQIDLGEQYGEFRNQGDTKKG